MFNLPVVPAAKHRYIKETTFNVSMQHVVHLITFAVALPAVKVLWRSASRCHAVCVSAALVSAAKVMRCIQCSLVDKLFSFQSHVITASNKVLCR